MTWRPRDLRIGAMRYRVTIQSPVESQDATGEQVVTWADYATREPSAFKPTGGTEYMRGRQLEASGIACFTIRFRSDITTLMRIVHDSLNYGILSVDAVEGGRRYLEITAKTVDQ